MNAPAQIREQFALARARGLRAREAAEAIGLSEGAAMAAHTGEHDRPLRAVPLRPEWLALLQALEPWRASVDPRLTEQLRRARLLVRAWALRDHGLPHTSEAAMCKWLAPKTAVEVIHQCLLTHGHAGYSKDLPHQQRLRDVMGLEIGDGTAQIMKLVIARERIGRVAVQYARQG